MSEGGTLRDQYKSNRNCFVDLEVAHELGSMEVASGPWLGVPLSIKVLPGDSGILKDSEQTLVKNRLQCPEYIWLIRRQC